MFSLLLSAWHAPTHMYIRAAAALLSLVGPDTFKILSSLLVPERPADKSYEELKEILTAHFCPKRSQVYYCSQFYQCVQKPGMSIAAYLSELQLIAKDCGFGDSLNTMLRDHLVCGVHDPTIQKHLLAKGDNLTFKDAVTQASTMESAVLDSKDLTPASASGQSQGSAHHVKH